MDRSSHVLVQKSPLESWRISWLLGKDEKGSFVVIWFDADIESKPLHELLKTEATLQQFGKQKPLPSDDDSEQFQALTKSIESATGVLLISNTPLATGEQILLGKLDKLLHSVIKRSGVVCGVGSVAEQFGKYRLVSPSAASLHANTVDQQLELGLNLLPDCIVEIGVADSDDSTVINTAVKLKPISRQAVGIGIPPNGSTELRNRKFHTIGDQKVTFSLAANDRQAHRVQRLAEVTDRRRTSPYKSVVDLTAWRRDAIDRTLPPFPPAKPPVPDVKNGTLLIVGGGGMPRGLMREFVDLAGGEQARLIYVPCSHRDKVSTNQGTIRQWRNMGVATVDILHTKDRIKANTDGDFLKPLSNATGIWFGGGRQWNFVDSYYGTKAHRLMKKVLQRGGVIGGSSAGASVQGDYLARANPVANFDIMAAGYERGLGFLTGVAIDQHFSQRGRQKDMTQLVDRYPQLLGIGIDESTALKVRRSEAEVVGRGKVFFYDRRRPVIDGEDDYIAVQAKGKFNLAERKVIEP